MIRIKENTIYVVNETCELECDTYTNCHGAFKDRKKAHEIADKVYNTAKEDISNAEFCYEELSVWNDVSKSKTEIIEIELQ